MNVLQDITYQQLGFSDVRYPVEFFKSGVNLSAAEVTNLKTIYNNIRVMFGIGASEVKLSVAMERKIYKFTLFSRKTMLGFIVYIPELKRIDLYLSENLSAPVIQWKGKKVVYSTIPVLLERLGILGMFNKLITVL